MRISIYLCFALFLLFISITNANVVINEIMYNPNGTDTNHEWVEIYNNGTDIENLTGWKFFEDNINHSLTLKQGNITIMNSSFAVIADDWVTFLLDYPAFNGTLFDSSFSLSNTGEYIAIKNSSLNITDSVTYSSSWGGNETNRTICRINDIFQECIPTPGFANALYTPSNMTNTTNETTETNSTNSTSNSCDLSLEITTNKLIFENEAVGYNLIVNDTLCNNTEKEINITYWAEDLFGNAVKDHTNTTQNTTCYKNISRSWTPADIFGSEGYYIKANITNPGCNDTNRSNDFYSKAIIFKGFGHPGGSYIKIIDINSGNTAKFGESVDVKLEIYKNTTSKYAIYSYIKNSAGTKVSETTTIHIKSQNTAYNMTVPVQLKHNCNRAYADGAYTVVIEGLDLTSTGSVNINGISESVCRIEQSGCSCPSCSCPKTSSSTTQSSKTNPDYEIITYKDVIQQDEEFETVVRLATSTSKNITIYSYVHSGNKIVSLGFSDGKWLAAWTANEQKIQLKNESINITLKNKVKDDTEPGMYNLRVRVNDGKEHDLDKNIRIIKREENKIVLNETNETSKNVTVQSIQPNQTSEESRVGSIITGLLAGANADKYIITPDQNRLIIYLFYIKHLLSGQH